MAERHRADSRAFWDAAAMRNAAWYVATGSVGVTDTFFAQGAAETDYYLAFCGIQLTSTDTVVEIGCGMGRMTRRLSELAGRVIATDVSGHMLDLCRHALADRSNVECLQLPGDGRLVGIPDQSADTVFSYITLQHVPTVEAQLRYLAEAARVLRSGGRVAVQVRAPGWRARGYDWAGHLAHFAAGRRTLRREWRGARLVTADINRTLLAAGACPHLRPHDDRHLWVIAQRDEQPAADRPR